MKDIIGSQKQLIAPVFVDYTKDVVTLTAKNNTQVYYTPNKSNDIFQLTYIFDCGTYSQPILKPALLLLPYLGTTTKSAQEIQDELYALGCEYRVAAGRNRSYAVLTGLNENLEPAVRLLEDVLTNAQVDSITYNSLIGLLAQEEQNARLNQQQNINKLSDYLMFGQHNPSTDEFTSSMLSTVSPEEISELITDLANYKHRIIYYGSQSEDELLKIINDAHYIGTPAKTDAQPDKYKYAQPTETVIYVAPYPSQQAYVQFYTCSGKQYSLEAEPLRHVYNEYFGGAMNSIVFQELRERRSLAYRAGATYESPNYSCQPYTFSGWVSTQYDKVKEAIQTFTEIVNQMPLSEDAFTIAKQSIDNRLRTSRIIKDGIAWDYIEAQELGNNHDIRKDLFDILPALTLDDIARFQQENLAGEPMIIGILGNIQELDMEELSKIGRVVILSQEQLLGN